MRRRLTAGAAVAWVVALGAVTFAAPAVAQPSPTAPPAESGEIEVPEPVPGEEVCQITDPRLVEISGLVAIDDGYIVVNDSSFGFPDRQPIFFLNQGCEVVDALFYPSPPLDPEDLELDRDNNILWVGDTGDNEAGEAGSGGQTRPTVALWRVDLSGDRTPVIHRFVYEDGEPRDAEALVLDSDGIPIIITKSLGAAELFKPTDLVPNNPPEQAVPLTKLGEFTPPDTGSDHDILPSAAARRTITGGATAPDGSAVALRTYTDAFEFEVVDGDVVAAITEGQPVVTPLPGEPWGEAISYSPDGELFLTTSEVPEQQPEFVPPIWSYTPATPPEPEPPPAEEETGSDGGGGGFSLVNEVQDIINLIAAVGVIGLLLVGAGVYGIVRSRRRGSGGEDPPEEGDEAAKGAPATGRARLGVEPATGRESAAGAAGVYGSAAARGTEYGGAAAGGYEDPAPAPEYRGNEYGRGREYGGGQYGGTEYGGGQYESSEYPGTAHRGGDYPEGPEYQPGAEYPGGGYQGSEYGGGYQGHEHRAEGYGADPYQGGQYGGAAPRAGYDPSYDGGYQGGDYDRGGYPADHYQGGHHQGAPDYDQGYGAGSGYGGGEHPGAQPAPGYDHGYPPDYQQPDPRGRGAAPNPPDNYSDDPDYPYEFRDPNRW